ncbi:methyltransferase-like protein 7B [Amphibalanus amphitrite]|nr:methyltransferase-like protein 7B [Amphibalanus amphitrite]XP_043204830.1 methyltransferase-like protein 7B [Amphibalanus amphitrite]
MLLDALGWACWLLGWSVWLLGWPASLLGWGLLAVMAARAALGPETAGSLHDRLMAWVFSRFLEQQEAHLGPLKADLFRPMAQMKSAQPELTDGAINILEVGVGCGTNLPYYPAGSQLTCVDPNPHFRAYFRSACAARAAHLSQEVRFVVGCGEQMADVADASVDAVVVTLVLCSVRDVTQVVREVHRVLRPGGKFFYLEHIAREEGSAVRRLQNVLTNSGMWPCLLQCWLNRDPRPVIESGLFQSVDQQLRPIVKKLKPWDMTNLTNQCLVGVATK